MPRAEPAWIIAAVGTYWIAAGVNTLSVHLEKTRSWLGRRWGKHAWKMHLAIITPGWVLAPLVGIRLSTEVQWELPHWTNGWAQAGGILLCIAGTGLVLDTVRRLGFTNTLNGREFGQGKPAIVTSGGFRFLSNPIYTGFALWWGAVSLLSGNAVFFVMAGTSFLALNCCEARVEN